MLNAEETLFGLFLPAVGKNIFLGTDFNLNANILRCLFCWGGSLMVREPLSHCEAASLSFTQGSPVGDRNFPHSILGKGGKPRGTHRLQACTLSHFSHCCQLWCPPRPADPAVEGQIPPWDPGHMRGKRTGPESSRPPPKGKEPKCHALN